MEENREYISYDVVDAGNEFLMHYGVKGMKWHQHKFNKDLTTGVLSGVGALDTSERRDARRKNRSASENTAKTLVKTGAKATRNIRQAKTKGLKTHKRTQVGSAVIKSLHPRQALYKGLNSNTKVRESFQKAERKAIDRRLAKQGARTVRGQKLMAQKRIIKKLPNGKAKKAAMKKWTLNREAFYETLP